MILGTFTRNFIRWVSLHISYNARFGWTEHLSNSAMCWWIGKKA